MSETSSKAGKVEATSTVVATATVTKIDAVNQNRVMIVLSNENLTAVTHDFYYAFGDSASAIGDFTQATMFRLRPDSDLYFTDGCSTGPLFVYQASGGNLTIKTCLD